MQRPEGAAERDSPFHAGERLVQSRLDVRESAERPARQAVRSYLPAQHREFYAGLPFVVMAARDAGGRPWATVLTGDPGFVRTPDDRRLLIDSRPAAGDALHGGLTTGGDVGVLGIDLATRRRNRVNGRLARHGAPIRIDVTQAFGNCPQYIHPRSWRRAKPAGGHAGVVRATRLHARARAWIQASDTMFIASGYRGEGDDPAFGMDASHRGGPSGFVRVVSDQRLAFPDYAGNNYFNTIGNLVMDPRIGLLFVDFTRGSLLQVTGLADIRWDPGEPGEHPGGQRLVTVDIEEVVELQEVLPLRWSGSRDAVRTLRLIDKVRESRDIVSFIFSARDGGQLPGFQAGQHLPLEVPVPGSDRPLQRTYSLSNAPGGDRYRISVKREPRGAASRYLHDHLTPGDTLNAGSPAGDFVLKPGDGPLALVSAGIGITPLLSMLHQTAGDAARRPTWFVHGARDGPRHAFADEVEALAATRGDIKLHVAYSRPGRGDVSGRDYDSAGRLDADLVARLVPLAEADLYLCGPAGFIAGLGTQLIDKGAAAERIHTEEFGRFA